MQIRARSATNILSLMGEDSSSYPNYKSYTPKGMFNIAHFQKLRHRNSDTDLAPHQPRIKVYKSDQFPCTPLGHPVNSQPGAFSFLVKGTLPHAGTSPPAPEKRSQLPRSRVVRHRTQKGEQGVGLVEVFNAEMRPT